MRASSSFLFLSPFAAAILPVSLAVGVAVPMVAAAEFRCVADISYTWVKSDGDGSQGRAAAPPPAGTQTPGGASQPKAGASGQAAATPKSEPGTPLAGPAATEPTIVHLMGVERVGATEAAAKKSLQTEVERQRIRASESCRRDHESFGTCVAMKLSGSSSVLNSLGFSARADLEKALTDECRQQQGTCVGVKVSEAVCSEIAVAGAPAAESPAPEAEKKPATKKK